MSRVVALTERLLFKGQQRLPAASHLRRRGSWGLLALLALLVCVPYAARQLAVQELERQGIEVKALGRETPLEFGAPFETLTLPVHGRSLQARVVQAQAPTSRALLIFHGNGESVSDWSRVQARLRDVGIASMVFDYSGFGLSTGRPSVAHLHEDGLAAYRAFVEQWPHAQARFVLGHSLGNAVMLDVLPALQPHPAGVVVHAGFTSAREMATQTGLAAPWLADLLPNLWDNEIAMARQGLATLVMHSDADEVIPPQMGLRLAEAAGAHARFVSLRGVRHDSVYQDATADEWQPIIDFIHDSGKAKAAAGTWPDTARWQP